MHIQTHQSKQVYPCDTCRQSLSFSPALLNTRTQKHTHPFSFAPSISRSLKKEIVLLLSRLHPSIQHTHARTTNTARARDRTSIDGCVAAGE